jgi:hypothetical protein
MTEKEVHDVKAMQSQLEQMKFIYNNLGKAIDLMGERIKMVLGEELSKEAPVRGAFKDPVQPVTAKGTGNAQEFLGNIPTPSAKEIREKTMDWSTAKNFNRGGA